MRSIEPLSFLGLRLGAVGGLLGIGWGILVPEKYFFIGIGFWTVIGILSGALLGVFLGVIVRSLSRSRYGADSGLTTAQTRGDAGTRDIIGSVMRATIVGLMIGLGFAGMFWTLYLAEMNVPLGSAIRGDARDVGSTFRGLLVLGGLVGASTGVLSGLLSAARRNKSLRQR